MASARKGDLCGALGLCVLLIVWSRWVTPQMDMPITRRIDTLGYVLVAVNALVLYWRRVTPRPVLAVTAVVSTLYMFLGYPYGPAILPLAVAVYTVAKHVPWRTAAIAAVAATPVLMLHNLDNGPQVTDLFGVLPAGGWVALPFAIGATIAIRQDAVAQERRQAVDRGVQDERLRMAQEVHDIVGHGLAAIKMQADIALHVYPSRPDVARPSLEAISTTSAHALEELRTTLRMMSSAAESQASTPGLADLEALYQRMREAGLLVRVQAGASPPACLPPEVDLVAYRTIQESLTNVLKHAYPKEADIVLTPEPGALRIMVTSAHAAARPPDREGMGISGMHARIAGLGGRLTAGPAPGARFIVDAWLPADGTP